MHKGATGAVSSSSSSLAKQIAQLEAQLEPEVKRETSFNHVIVVDNLPIVPLGDKYDRLMGHILKIFEQIGLRKDGVTMPIDPATSQTVGCAFVEFHTSEQAAVAAEQADGYKLGKGHVFKVTRYSEFERLLAVSDVYEPPPQKVFPARPNLHEWLTDPLFVAGNDQYALRYGDYTELLWTTPTEPAPTRAAGFEEPRRYMTDSSVKFSPLGTYLATFHPQGIMCWGTKEFSKLVRLAHTGVKQLEFSPCERYMITMSVAFPSDDPADPQAISVWEIATQRRLRGFLAPKVAGKDVWPCFKWSHDGKYVAQMSEDKISVYETPSMQLLDKKSLKIPGVKDFSWSPKANLIAYTVPERGNAPARICLVEIPSRNEIRSQTLFLVSDMALVWQAAGDFLCVKVDRFAKNRKATYTHLELMRTTNPRRIGVDVCEFKDNIIEFAWQPHGAHFGVIHNETATRPDVSIYRMGEKVELVKTLEKKAATKLSWAPRGDMLVIAGLKAFNGSLEWFSLDEKDIVAVDEHFMCTDCEWDPTGRVFASFVSAWKSQLENGYRLWSSQGKLLRHVAKELFYSLAWRPRPATLLTEADEKRILKQLPEHTKAMRDEDRSKAEVARAARIAERLIARRRMLAHKEQRHSRYVEERAARRAARNGLDSDDDVEMEIVERLVEEVIERKEVPV